MILLDLAPACSNQTQILGQHQRQRIFIICHLLLEMETFTTFSGVLGKRDVRCAGMRQIAEAEKEL
jgi:hypothetical protein